MPAPASGQQQPACVRFSLAVVARMDRLAVWLVVAVAMAVAMLVLVNGQSSYERPLLLQGLNFLFGTLVSLFIAFWIGRMYLRQCRPGLLLLGCGILFWGLAGVAGAWFNVNTRITINNTAVWMAAFCHLSGVAISIKLHETTRKPHIWLPIGYLGVVIAVVLITLAATTDRMPLFFLPGQGGTMTRHLVLGSAIAMFVLTAILSRLMMSRQVEQVFLRWYSLALLLFAVGLVAVSFQKVNGGLLGWTGRAAQYLGSVYMLVAILRSTHGFRQAGMILERTADGTMPRLGVAAAVAVVSTASAVTVRLLFFHDLGTSLSYLTFFPAVILAAFVGGFGSGVLTTLLSLLFVSWTELLGLQAFSFPVHDLTESALFFVSGLLVALAARTTHRAQSQTILAMAETQRVSELAVAADALRASEERLARVIEGTEAGIWDWYVQTGEVVFNERWAEIAGYTLAELAPVSIRTWRDLVHPEDLPTTETQMAEVFARPGYSIEYRIRHRNGGWVWVQDRGKVMERTEEGKPWRLSGARTDITARKQAEARLVALTRELEAILETAPIGVAKVIERKLVWVNRGMEELLLYPKDEVLFQSSSIIYPSRGDYDALGRDAYPLLAQGGIYQAEKHLLRRDGTVILAKLTGRVIDAADPAQGAIWTVEDITERKGLEEAARERAELFTALFEKNKAVQLLIDPRDGAVIDANAAAAAYYGYPPERLKSLNIDDINTLSLAEIRQEMTTAAKVWGAPFLFRHRLASGELRDVQVFSSPIKIGGRTLLHSIVHDVTERKRIEQELQRSKETAIAADAAKSKLLATVAHEFRTPLSLLQSSLDILDRYGERLSEAQRNEQDRYIRSATKQLTNLADTVLTYRTMEKDAWHGQAEPCDIGELCRAIADEIRAAWAGGHDFKVNVAPECGEMLVDKVLFRRVLGNLLANAFQYTPPERTVSLDMRRDGGSLRVVVADQGIGMEAEDRNRVFDSFYRGRNVGQRRGMGLGLSIVRDALHRMNGTVALTSEAGTGTTVTITLPWREVGV